MKRIKCLVLLLIVFPAVAFAEDAANGGTSIIDFFKSVLGFFDHGIYEVFGNFFKYYVTTVALFSLELKMAALEVATNAASILLSHLDISGTINSMYSQIDSRLAAFMSYLRIPESINILLSAHVTRFIMDLV
jgi:hypothetical protein